MTPSVDSGTAGSAPGFGKDDSGISSRVALAVIRHPHDFTKTTKRKKRSLSTSLEGSYAEFNGLRYSYAMASGIRSRVA